ncbi:uncharacterized protein LOC120249550 [Dioscorea cayenensis subsp. rotundata]|uniref:Uncharacterized protein LOC120249550 n=1 Tax=Dioscorea cayennensis subsp. rotundata TaxID=55577 RepID=A0AB40AGQ0_DIOCR|nr:uncharacterized protein LOC120249550 [Dioscorea cayenensis subsp. rotundata]
MRRYKNRGNMPISYKEAKTIWEALIKKFSIEDATKQKLSRYTQNPNHEHWYALVKLMKYLRGTMNYGIVYSGYLVVLEGYNDTNWISDSNETKSTSCYVFTLGGGAVAWKSARQTIIAESTIEAEFVNLVLTESEADWLRNFFANIPLAKDLLSQQDLSSLDNPFSQEEIRRAVFDLNADKAPGPDGFPIFFFQKYWEIVKDDIYKLCDDFYWGRANLERINWANIALIPKNQSSENPSQFRPISLINSSLKIISKILANRLRSKINALIDETQSAFIKGRCITDNIVAANELIFYMQKHRLPGLILKVDFANAFDTVDWEFLLELLHASGFSDKWISSINSIFTSTKAKFLINGNQSGYIRYRRGLRQGDPLSPLLFALVVDVLSTMFNNALNSGILYGVALGGTGIRMCHLQYADDLLILTNGGVEDLRIIKLILYLFECISGLKVNSDKTCLYAAMRNQIPHIAQGIDRIRRDFLWSGPDNQQGKIRLWWWKIASDTRWCGKAILSEIYYRNSPMWNLYHKHCRRRSFFWNGIMYSLPTFRKNLISISRNGASTLFWLDNWVEGRAPAELWPHVYQSALHQDVTIRDFLSNTSMSLLSDSPKWRNLINFAMALTSEENDEKRWSLTANGCFSVKLFYNFLNDGGLRCATTPVILKSICPKKINLFNWLAWDNKILTLDNLALRRCNLLHSTTCVLCNAAIETTDHLLLHCSFASHIWNYFGQLFGIFLSPGSLVDLWRSWRSILSKNLFPFWDLLVRAINWNIWLERNARIFNSNCLSTVAIIFKINCMIISWYDAAPEAKKAKLEDPVSKIKRSLEFLSSADVVQVESTSRPTSPGET